MHWPEITRKTPLEEVKRIHQRIWQYVVDHGEKPTETPYFVNCVLCEYDELFCKEDAYEACDYCPVNISRHRNTCLNGMYKHWMIAIDRHDISEARKTAIAIRDIPFKYES